MPLTRLENRDRSVQIQNVVQTEKPAGLPRGSNLNHAIFTSTRRVIVALPAFNEAEVIGVLLNRINDTLASQSLNYKIVVVDDGSSDNTAEIVRSFGQHANVHLVQHQINQGLGTTLRTAFDAALAKADDDDIIMTMDADNTHPPELMHRMIRMIEEGHDVVIASRFENGARVVGVPYHRHLLSIAAKYLFATILPIKGVRDYTCGYRAYKAGLLREAIETHGEKFVSETGFSCMVDVLIKLRGQKPIVGEVPLILRYDHKGGDSKMKVLRTITQTLKLIFSRRFGKLS